MRAIVLTIVALLALPASAFGQTYYGQDGRSASFGSDAVRTVIAGGRIEQFVSPQGYEALVSLTGYYAGSAFINLPIFTYSQPSYNKHTGWHDEIEESGIPCPYFAARGRRFAFRDDAEIAACSTTIKVSRRFVKRTMRRGKLRKNRSRRIGNWQCLANTHSHFYCENTNNDDEFDTTLVGTDQWAKYRLVRDRGYLDCGDWTSYNNRQIVYSRNPDQCGEFTPTGDHYNRQAVTAMQEVETSPGVFKQYRRQPVAAYGCYQVAAASGSYIHKCNINGGSFLVKDVRNTPDGYGTRAIRLVDGSLWVVPLWAD